MKNIYLKLSSSTSICYFYILLLITSLLARPDTLIMKLFTLTTTITSIYILLDLKEKLNTRLGMHSLDMFFFIFIAIKGLISIMHIMGFEYLSLINTLPFRGSFALIQLIYAIKLITYRTRLIKGLSLYGFVIAGSALFLLFSGGYEVSFVLSIFNTYILGEVFREFEDISPRYS